MEGANLVHNLFYFFFFVQGSKPTPGLNFAEQKIQAPNIPSLPSLVICDAATSYTPRKHKAGSILPLQHGTHLHWPHSPGALQISPQDHAQFLLKLPRLFSKQLQAAVIPTWPFKSQAVTSLSWIIDAASHHGHDRQPTARKGKGIAPRQWSWVSCEWAFSCLGNIWRNIPTSSLASTNTGSKMCCTG